MAETGERHIAIGKKAAERLGLRLEIGLARAVLGGSPDNLAALEMLGTALTRAGKHEDALQADLRATTIAPTSATAFYNLACSYSNLDNVDEGLDALKQALKLGYRDYNHMLGDPDLENIRRDPRFRRLLDRKWGKRQSS